MRSCTSFTSVTAPSNTGRSFNGRGLVRPASEAPDRRERRFLSTRSGPSSPKSTRASGQSARQLVIAMPGPIISKAWEGPAWRNPPRFRPSTDC
jgi:hypothetical protein